MADYPSRASQAGASRRLAILLARDVEIAVRRNGCTFGKVKISKGAIDSMPANKSKTAYYLDWSEFAKLMAEGGHPL